MIDLTASPLTTTTDRGQKLTVPRVHLNGDSGETLRDQFLTALGKVQDAAFALRAGAPNARNFYVDSKNGDAYIQATREHLARLQLLDLVAEELAALGEAVQDQIDQRRRGRR